MTHGDHRVNVAAGIEISHQFHPLGCSGSHQIIEDAIHHLLMGDGLITPTVDVELEGFELKNARAGLLGELQLGEIGIARKRALAGELRQGNRHVIGAPLAGIVETDQLCLSDGPLAIGRTLSAA